MEHLCCCNINTPTVEYYALSRQIFITLAAAAESIMRFIEFYHFNPCGVYIYHFYDDGLEL